MYKSTHLKKTARCVAVACGFLFAVFSVLYLHAMQSGLLATAQHLLSKGKTVYSPWWGTVIITFLLLMLQYAYRKAVYIPVKFAALYYFPSCLVLGILTSIIPDKGWAVRLDVDWGFVLICILLYLSALWFVKHFPDKKNHNKSNVFSYLWVNFLFLSMGMLMTGSIGNTNDVYHYRLQMERCLAEKEDTAALEIGRLSLQSDRDLTAMRAFALSRTHQMGDKLFEFPQYFGSEGLMPTPSDTISVHNWVNELHVHLGGKPNAGLSGTTRFFELLAQRVSATKAVGDYLLCAYLLDKNLDAFVQMLPGYYVVDESLPLYYKEALVLYNRLHTKPELIYKDPVVETNLNDFLHYEKRFKNPQERANQCKRMYGNTYWWYYNYQDKKE